MVDRYFRKIESVENHVENSMQISSILLKLSEYDKNSSDLSKITTNEGNISSNLGKITTNEGDISSNLGKINTNKSNIDEIKSDLSNIDFNSNNKYSIENFFNYNIKIENNYILSKDKPDFSISKYTLEDDFKKDGTVVSHIYTYDRAQNILNFEQPLQKLIL